ncbi:MAG: hypothetical protein HUU02_09020 [Bacteroidetes bacterium]|nr:hypothetical protein [Bacteroidota bacterium]
MDLHSSHIPPLLRVVVSGTASLQEVNALVRHAHHFALIRLKQLMASGRLHLQSFPVTLESTALDCIAELFERDAEGRFIELEQYFTVEHDADGLADDELIAMLRSLVFTKLNDGLFALYRENDPVLSKIIRNIKLAAEKAGGVTVDRILGIPVLRVDCGEDRTPGTEVTLEDLEARFSETLHGTRSTGEYLLSLKEHLLGNKDLRDTVSLIDCAVCIKRHMLQYQVSLHQVMMEDATLFEGDASVLIDGTLRRMEQELAGRYVRKNRLDQHSFHAYMRAIAAMTKDTYLRSDGNERKYGEYLQEHLPGLTYDEYRQHHRKQFEYMATLVKKAVKQRLKELL